MRNWLGAQLAYWFRTIVAGSIRSARNTGGSDAMTAAVMMVTTGTVMIVRSVVLTWYRSVPVYPFERVPIPDQPWRRGRA